MDSGVFIRETPGRKSVAKPLWKLQETVNLAEVAAQARPTGQFSRARARGRWRLWGTANVMFFDRGTF